MMEFVKNMGARHNTKRTKTHARDIVYTPKPLARKCMSLFTFRDAQPRITVLDPCKGVGAFYNFFPNTVKKLWCEIEEGKDFYKFNDIVDWCISNPPYSHLDKFLEHTTHITRIGFGYLIGVLNLTAVRIQFLNERGFYLSTLMLINNVRGWFGRHCFVVFDTLRNKNDAEIILDLEIYNKKDRDNKVKIHQQQKNNTKLEDFF